MLTSTAEPTPLRILIVEDNPLQAQALRIGLKQLGYVVLGVAATTAEAERLFRAEAPDLLLLDIHLALEDDAGDGTPVRDGIDLAATLLANRPTPLIFLTSLADDATFRRAQQVAPAAFLVKPFEADSLRRAIELAVVRASVVQGADAPAGSGQTAAGLSSDVLFVRHAGRLERVNLQHVTHLANDNSYCELHLASGLRYALHASMREVEDALPAGRFVRIHRSYLAAWDAIEAVDASTMEIRLTGGVKLPIGRTYRDDVLAALPVFGKKPRP